MDVVKNKNTQIRITSIQKIKVQKRKQEIKKKRRKFEINKYKKNQM